MEKAKARKTATSADKRSSTNPRKRNRDLSRVKTKVLASRGAEQAAESVLPRSRRSSGTSSPARDQEARRTQAPLQDQEMGRTRLAALVALGKERGFLSYAEVSDHLPDDMLDAEQLDSLIAMLGDLGIQINEKAVAPEADLLRVASDGLQSEDGE